MMLETISVEGYKKKNFKASSRRKEKTPREGIGPRRGVTPGATMKASEESFGSKVLGGRDPRERNG